MSQRRVVTLAGLSGVGKSKLLENARRRFVFEHLQASDLIKVERRSAKASLLPTIFCEKELSTTTKSF